MVNTFDNSTEYEQITQPYSVYITDEKNSSSGSGVLYYSGAEEFFYVFTCAHVVDKMDTIILGLLLPGNSPLEECTPRSILVPDAQIVYYPLDEIDEHGNHSHDVAVIRVAKDEKLQLRRTDYFVSEPRRTENLFIQGFPGGKEEGESLMEILDSSFGVVLHCLQSKPKFQIRLTDTFLDQGQRIYETHGFSGAPVWNTSEDVLNIFGLLESAARQTAYRGKYYAAKMSMVQSIMKNHFEQPLKSKISGIPESDVAVPREDLQFNGAANMNESINTQGEWLQLSVEKVRACIDELQMQSAITLAKEIILDSKFERSSDIDKKLLLQQLLYCYEICYLDEAFRNTEEKMRGYGYIEDHDELRWMTKQFGRRKFDELIQYTGEYMCNHAEENGGEQYVIAQLFSVLSRAYTENLPIQDTVRMFVDEKEQLTISLEDKGTEVLIYQMIGYVYGEHYKMYDKSIRCLNRSYRYENNKVVLQSVAAAYYFLAIQKATRKDDTVDMDLIDRRSLYKARECFLIILDKADELFLSSLMKNVGLVVFNTFVFLMDNYRVLALYPILRKYMGDLEERVVRDIEMNHAKIKLRTGMINLEEYTSLTDVDKMFLSITADVQKCLMSVDVHAPGHAIANHIMEQQVKCVIEKTERYLPEIDEKEQMSIRVMLINLYGKGITLFNWNALPLMKQHYEAVKISNNQDIVECMNSFIYEYEHSFEEAEGMFVKVLENRPGFRMWQELLNFYKRHLKFDKADTLFTDLFNNHFDWVEEEPEFAYRGYFDYIMRYRRDMKNALRCYIDNKAKLLDSEVTGFWELELMLYTNTFNDPERYEQERQSLVAKELISIEEYHRTAFIAYMCNLNVHKAEEHRAYLNFKDLLAVPAMRREVVTREQAHFFAWRKQLVLQYDPNWQGMIPAQLERVLEEYLVEEWRESVSKVADSKKFSIERNAAIDAWSLYVIAEDDKLDLLDKFDNVYVTHTTVSRIMEEITHCQNYPLHNVLQYISEHDNVHIRTANFEHQLLVRDRIPYNEPASTIAISKEIDCIAVIGEIYTVEELIRGYRNIIVRPVDVEKLC